MKYLKMLGLAAVAALALMAVVGARDASATTLKVNGITQTGTVEIGASLEGGTKIIWKDGAGTTLDECFGSEIEGKVTTVTGASVSGPLSKLTISLCSHTTTTLAPGHLSITQIGSTANGTVVSIGAEITIVSTTFGASAVCKTGAGTDIGTLTGATNGTSNTSKFATLDLNGKISCGILGTSTWTGSYIVTSPVELAVTG